jgi:OPA family glycerol-3-phosphate transporter-like MFS transporter
MNLLIPFCQNAVQMSVVWCVNGFAQSLMWPPMVRLMTALLDEQNYKTTTTKVIWGSSIGTIVVYLVSPLLITLFSWKAVFWFSAVCGIVMLLIWNRCSYEIGVHKRMVNTDAPAQKTSWFGPLMAFVMVAIVSQGMLRDGITTWMPTYISDTYHLGSAISILTGVLLPVFSMICCQVCTKLYISRFTNPLTCAGVFFAVGTLAAAGLSLFTGENAAFSVAFTALLTGCMHGVNLILICMIPAFFANTGKVSAISGILNSCTYVGSAISTYGIAFLSEKCGWDFTLLMWLGIAALGAVICFSCARSWHRKFGEI